MLPPVGRQNRSSVRAQAVVTGRTGGALFAARFRCSIGGPASQVDGSVGSPIDATLDHGELLAHEVTICDEDTPTNDHVARISSRPIDSWPCLDWFRPGTLRAPVNSSVLPANTISSRSELRTIRARVGQELWPDDFQLAPYRNPRSGRTARVRPSTGRSPPMRQTRRPGD